MLLDPLLITISWPVISFMPLVIEVLLPVMKIVLPVPFNVFVPFVMLNDSPECITLDESSMVNVPPVIFPVLLLKVILVVLVLVMERLQYPQ